MKLNNIFILSFIVLFNLNDISAQNEKLSCNYNTTASQYSCHLTIYNPNGLNNFQGINGTHLAGKTDDDVKILHQASGSNSSNIPSIICNKFKNLERIELKQINIQKIDEDSFKGCTRLVHLNLHYNKISVIDEMSFNENKDLAWLRLWGNQLTILPANLFANQQKLGYLDLDNNRISDLPKNIFQPLRKLTTLDLRANQIEIIHSESFSTLPNLTTVHFHNNKINATDERFIDNTGVTNLNMQSNLCVNKNIIDNSTSRDSMRAGLRVCIENYEKIMNETTTVTSTSTTTTESTTTTTVITTPPRCPIGNLDDRVCTLEDEIERLDTVNAEMQDEIERLDRTFTAAIDDLQNQILELSSRPCACR